MRQGHNQVDQIMNAAFGKRSGPIDDLGRLILAKLLEDGLATRKRSTDHGLPYIWKLINV